MESKASSQDELDFFFRFVRVLFYPVHDSAHFNAELCIPLMFVSYVFSRRSYSIYLWMLIERGIFVSDDNFRSKMTNCNESKEINKAKSNYTHRINWQKCVGHAAKGNERQWSKSFGMAFQGIPCIPNYRNVKVVDNFREETLLLFSVVLWQRREKRRSQSRFNILLVSLHVLPKLRIFHSFIYRWWWWCARVSEWAFNMILYA